MILRKKIKKIKFKNLIIQNFLKIHISKTYINWLNDQEVVKYSSQKNFYHSYKSCLNYYNKIQYQNCFFLCIFYKKKHIGNIYCKIKSSKSVSIRIIIGNKKFWGKGIGYDVYSLLIDYFFEKLSFTKVYSNTKNENHGMKKLLEKLRKKYRYKVIKKNKIIRVIFYK